MTVSPAAHPSPHIGIGARRVGECARHPALPALVSRHHDLHLGVRGDRPPAPVPGHLRCARQKGHL